MLRQVHGHSGIPVLFGGQVENTRLSLSQFIGVRTVGLRRLRVRAEGGLVGRVLTTGAAGQGGRLQVGPLDHARL
ncbi:hypothetical protein AB0G20_10380 [Streptomyces sp. NPDC024017]|uniref:hypothetical protein n=1 Tax=Streptomyces sp. NPDC024017 TaxID=3154326 RepID=UPI0033CE5CB3